MLAIRYWFCVGVGVLGVVAGLGVPGAHAAGRDLLVTSYYNRSVQRYDITTKAYKGPFVSIGSCGLRYATGLTFGPDGNLYVGDSSGTSTGVGTVMRYNGQTGACIDTFASGGELYGPADMAFGPDGNLYVVSTWRSWLNRYHGTTGAFINHFIPEFRGGLDGPDAILFKGDYLYVSTAPLSTSDPYPGCVLCYNAMTGVLVGEGEFISPGSGGLSAPADMTFGPDGNLYVVSLGTNNVLRYSGTTGAFIDIFTKTEGAGSLYYPIGLAFGPDGKLYVANWGGGNIKRYDGTTGAFLDVFASLAGPWEIVFMPHPADFDADEDVDIKDLERFQACVTGATIPYNPAALPPGCTMPVNASSRIAADFDQDGDVDHHDFGVFQRCYSGAGKPADPSCAE